MAIITLNEEERLPGCLASVAFATQVVVVDSGSTDRTTSIAKEFGAEVYDEPWQGFGRQKQLAIDRCNQEWILVLDADERVSDDAQQEIIKVIATAAPNVAYSLPRRNYFCGRWIKHMGWWPDGVVRLFRKGAARMSDRLVHEALEVDGPVGELSQPLIHYTNRSLSQTLSKINRYSSAGAEQLYSKGIKASAIKAFARASWAFAHNYFIRGGFLDGGEGLILAVSDFMNVFFKFAKLREMHLQPKNDQPS